MILTLSLLLVLVPSLKREVFLRLLSFFILLRNQYVLIQILCRMLESHLGCTTNQFQQTERFFSLANILLKQSTTLQCLFCLLAAHFPFRYSPNRLLQAFDIAETKWINHENDNDSDNDNDSENDNDNQGPVPERPISFNPGLKFCSVSVFLFLFIALGNILCYHYCISQ